MKHILFVDDERQLMDSLRARLYKHRHDWNMSFLYSGEEAIAALEAQHVDLIVSDVRMPGMDGGQLLSVVKQRWPTTVRIIVSGYSDPVQAVRLTSIAHQYVAKPCDARELENIIDRCFHLQALLSQESLRRVVGRIGSLPAMPKTYARLQTALSQITVTAGEIADIVNADAAIASKVLQVTNSAFFRLRKPIVRIKDAVTYLGFATIRNLVLSAEIFSEWKIPLDLPEFDREQLQNHAQSMAAACKSLAEGRMSADDAWLAGLVSRHRLLDTRPRMSGRAGAGPRSGATGVLTPIRVRAAGHWRDACGDRRLSAGPMGFAVFDRRGGRPAPHAGDRYSAWV